MICNAFDATELFDADPNFPWCPGEDEVGLPCFIAVFDEEADGIVISGALLMYSPANPFPHRITEKGGVTHFKPEDAPAKLDELLSDSSLTFRGWSPS